MRFMKLFGSHCSWVKNRSNRVLPWLTDCWKILFYIEWKVLIYTIEQCNVLHHFNALTNNCFFAVSKFVFRNLFMFEILFHPIFRPLYINLQYGGAALSFLPSSGIVFFLFLCLNCSVKHNKYSTNIRLKLRLS